MADLMDADAPHQFESFYKTYFPRLVRFVIISQNAGKHEAEDVAQESMIAAFRSWDQIDNAWAYVLKAAPRITVRLRQRRREAYHVVGPDSPLYNDLRGIDVQYRSDGAWLWTLVARLSKQQRTVIALWLDGYSFSETADFLGIAESTVRRHFKMAKDGLRQLLKEGYGNDR